MPDPEDRQIIEYDRLNWIGKTVFLAGTLVNGAAALIDTALDKTVDLVLEAERAFKEGLDSSVENAKILDEWEEDEEVTSVE